MMNAKNLFFIMLVGFTLIIISGILFYYNPATEKLAEVEKELKVNTSRFNNASHANRDITNVKLKYEERQESLRKIEKRFIYRKELGNITEKLQGHAQRYGLRLIDFTPIFRVYFADTSSSPVKRLPFTLTVSGSYLDIGRFLESWPDMEFFITSGQLYLGKTGKKSNRIEADITGLLYAWGDTGGGHDPR